MSSGAWDLISQRANERCAAPVNERYERMSERTREWPSTYVSIFGAALNQRAAPQQNVTSQRARVRVRGREKWVLESSLDAAQ